MAPLLAIVWVAKWGTKKTPSDTRNAVTTVQESVHKQPVSSCAARLLT